MVLLALLILRAQDYSQSLIPILSMFCTLISIILSVFEHFLSKKFLHVASSIIFTFIVKSDDIASMPYRKFQAEFIFKQYKLIHTVSKLLSVSFDRVERLKPKLTKDGAMYTFTVAVDSTQHRQVELSIFEIVQNGVLAKV